MSSRAPLHVCWLDPGIGEANAHLDLKARFQGISNRIQEWHYFDCGDQFTEFVDNNPNIKIVAIMSGSFGKRLVNPLADRDALHSVYIYCGNLDKYRTLTQDEPKIRAIFNSDQALYERMQTDFQREFP